MEITTKQLRIEPGKIIAQAANGQEITVTYRGKPCAKIVPIVNRKDFVSEEQADEYGASELFGIWKNRKDTANVEQFVRTMRKGRKL